MKAVNFFGGPAARKSTLAAATYVALKEQGIPADLVREYATYLILSGREEQLKKDQLSVLAKQHHLMDILRGKVEVAVTDSPLPLNALYAAPGTPAAFSMMVFDYFNQIRNAVRDYAYAHNFPFFDLRTQEGLLRNIMIRTSSTGELMVVLQCKVTDDEGRRKMEEILQFMADSFPQITSLMYVINNKCNDTIGDLDVEVFKGNDHIFEEMEGLRFKVGPKSFYQTNSEQAYNLYKVAREFAGLTGNELVYDLYTGTGTIANFVARQARKVVGIEYVPEAIEDAKVNSALNGIDNTLFYAGDMKDILTNDFIAEHGRPDVIITDPPRAGMHNDVIDVILAAEPKRIVYVSCNPATQARDLQLLDGKYKVTAVQPVDMFPHTHHVENVVQLERR
jgi:23S rRNA (uracil1939-C5)-methyltransferase